MKTLEQLRINDPDKSVPNSADFNGLVDTLHRLFSSLPVKLFSEEDVNALVALKISDVNKVTPNANDFNRLIDILKRLFYPTQWSPNPIHMNSELSNDQLTSTLREMQDSIMQLNRNIPLERSLYNDWVVENEKSSAALHLRCDNVADSYITNRNNFVDNGSTENKNLTISTAKDFIIQTGDRKIVDGWEKNVGIDRFYISRDGQTNLNGHFNINTPNNSILRSIRGDSDFDIEQSDVSEVRTLSIHAGLKGKQVFEVFGSQEINGNKAHIPGITVLNKSANVGIGTRTPNLAKLHLEGECYFNRPNGTRFQSIRGDSDFDIQQSNDSNSRAFTVHGGEKNEEAVFEVWAKEKNALSISNASGDVNVGTKLHIAGDLEVNGKIMFSDHTEQRSKMKFLSGQIWSGLFPKKGNPDQDNGRTIEKKVDFNVFSNPPTVFIAINSFDISNGKNSRIRVWADNVGKTGFTAYFHTWSDTLIHNCGANWIAIGE